MDKSTGKPKNNFLRNRVDFKRDSRTVELQTKRRLHMLSVSIKSEELRKDLKVFCAANGRKIFEVVETAIREYLSKHESK